MTTGFQQTRHDGDGELFASADQRGIDAIRALTQQANTVQDMLNLSKLLLNKGFQLGERESGLGVGKALKKFGKNAFSVGNIGEGILAANGLFNHRYQMVSDLRRGRQDGRYLPCLALLSRISATRRNRSAFATDVPPNFNTRMVLTP